MSLRMLSAAVAGLILSISPVAADPAFRMTLQVPLLLSSDRGDPISVTVDPSVPLSVELGDAFSALASASGGSGSFEYRLTGNIPPGITLNGRTVSGNFLAVGEYDFSVEVEDVESGSTIDRDFSVEVRAPITIAYESTSFFGRINVPVAIAAPSVFGAQSGYSVSLASGSLPVALSLDGGIAGTTATAGSGTAGIIATDSVNRTSQPTSVSWSILQEIVVSAPTEIQYTEGAPVSAALPSATNTHGTLSWSLDSGSLPTGLTVDSASGRITGTVPVGTNAADGTVRLRVTDAISGSASAPILLTKVSALVATIPDQATNVTLQDLFTAAEWTSNNPKTVIIEDGSTVGSNSTSIPAIMTGTGWGGTLTLDNRGDIIGAGGARRATGGDAIRADALGLKLINSGGIFSGAGGGGDGGQGGQGAQVKSVGPYSSWSSYCRQYGGSMSIYWGGSLVKSNATWNSSLGAYEVSSTAYQCGSVTNTSGGYTYYQIRRATISLNYTPGGAGGLGGRGAGFNVTAASGSAGTAGTNGSGAGGLGGSGGALGQSGNAGANGANGSYSGGSVGNSVGLAGFAIRNPSYVTVTDAGGQIVGR